MRYFIETRDRIYSKIFGFYAFQKTWGKVWAKTPGQHKKLNSKTQIHLKLPQHGKSKKKQKQLVTYLEIKWHKKLQKLIQRVLPRSNEIDDTCANR